jgi:hypothetical protein
MDGLRRHTQDQEAGKHVAILERGVLKQHESIA